MSARRWLAVSERNHGSLRATRTSTGTAGVTATHDGTDHRLQTQTQNRLPVCNFVLRWQLRFERGGSLRPGAEESCCDHRQGAGSHMIVERGTRSDAELVRALGEGDLDAFAALVERYRDACTRFAVRMTGSALDADDVMQSVWMRALRNVKSCKNPDRFGAWLYQIVINESRTYTKRRHQRDSRFIDDQFVVESIPAAEQPDVALRDETRAEIQRALDCLPLEQREAFLLKYVEEMDYETMSELTGVGVSALKMRVSRACERLRVLLEGVNHA